MTVKPKRFKNYAEAEDAAVRAAEKLTLHGRAVHALVQGRVHWLERTHSRGRIRLGLAWPESPSGGVIILVQEFPTNTVSDVFPADAFAAAWPPRRDRDDEARALRELAAEAVALRDRLAAGAGGVA